MIKSTEIRLGNLVFLDDDSIWKVKEVSDRHLRCIPFDKNKIGYTHDDLECFSPIPLTEEWLIKAGFELEESLYYQNEVKEYYLGNFYINYFPDKNIFSYDSSSRDIESIHHLQNIYYSHILEELTFDH